MDYKDIIYRIGYFRNKKRISAYELGQRLGHAKTYFYRIESGEIMLDMETFLDILTILEVPVEEFFYPNLNEFKDDKERLSFVKSLNKEEIEVLSKLLRRN